MPLRRRALTCLVPGQVYMYSGRRFTAGVHSLALRADRKAIWLLF